MPRIYKLSRAGLRLLYKIRHHKGHGIHSPFVFNLINKVIEEKTPYHKYDDLKKYIEANSTAKYKLTKYEYLSFRLVNYFEAKTIIEIGSGNGINTLYLTAPFSDVSCVCINNSTAATNNAKRLLANWNRNISIKEDKELEFDTKKRDCVYINLSEYKKVTEKTINYIKTISNDKTFIVVKDIRTNKRTKAIWRKISEIEERTAVLDLFNMGIVFFDKSLYKWNYQISF